MRKVLALFLLLAVLFSFGAFDVMAQEATDASGATGFQMLKEKFIEGNWMFMSFVLVCLILGLAFCIERIITLNIATTNTEKLLNDISERLEQQDLEGAMEVCKSTQGPTASILYEGLKNTDKGPEAVEKAIVSYGSVQMGLLEKVWSGSHFLLPLPQCLVSWVRL